MRCEQVENLGAHSSNIEKNRPAGAGDETANIHSSQSDEIPSRMFKSRDCEQLIVMLNKKKIVILNSREFQVFCFWGCRNRSYLLNLFVAVEWTTWAKTRFGLHLRFGGKLVNIMGDDSMEEAKETCHGK